MQNSMDRAAVVHRTFTFRWEKAPGFSLIKLPRGLNQGMGFKPGFKPLCWDSQVASKLSPSPGNFFLPLSVQGG